MDFDILTFLKVDIYDSAPLVEQHGIAICLFERPNIVIKCSTDVMSLGRDHLNVENMHQLCSSMWCH